MRAMSKLVCTGTKMKCTYGLVPSNLVAPPTNRVHTSNTPVATILDHMSLSNIPPFGLCTSPMNPAVVTSGIPQPCVPIIPSPWISSSRKVMMSGNLALDSNSRCMCAWAGVITILYAEQQKVIMK